MCTDRQMGSDEGYAAVVCTLTAPETACPALVNPLDNCQLNKQYCGERCRLQYYAPRSRYKLLGFLLALLLCVRTYLLSPFFFERLNLRFRKNDQSSSV